jgi:hypothetical protein
MNELLKLNKKYLVKGYVWISGILTAGFSIYLFFFYNEVSIKWIFITYLLTLIILPLFVIGTWIFDWFRKRKHKDNILKKEPYSKLQTIGFTKKTTRKNHNGLVDIVPFAQFNGCELIFDIDRKNPNVVEFHIFGLTNHSNNSEFKQNLKDLKLYNIDFGYFGFAKEINTNKEQLNSIQELQHILTEFTEIVKKFNYNPIQVTEWNKV